MRVTWLHMNSYNYTVIYKILCQYRKANDNNVNNMHYILNSYLLLQQITTWVTFTSHEKSLNIFFFKKPNPFVYLGTCKNQINNIFLFPLKNFVTQWVFSEVRTRYVIRRLNLCRNRVTSGDDRYPGLALTLLLLKGW